LARGTVVPFQKDGFVRKHFDRCDDCEYRGALANDGHPLYVNGFNLSINCEGCGGTGQVPRNDTRDPYWTGR